MINYQDFGKTGKDLMNEETVEFLFPYVDLGLEQNGRTRSTPPLNTCYGLLRTRVSPQVANTCFLFRTRLK